MARRKSSVAKYYSVRFNPATNQEDAEVLRIIERYEAQGYTFKDIIRAAILTEEGFDPALFSGKLQAGLIVSSMETLLAEFAEHIIREMGGKGERRGRQTVRYADDDDSDDDDDTPSGEARNFAKGFIRRQQSGGRT